MASLGKVLIVVQNLPVPFDRRVWLEATTLKRAGYEVSVISPKGKEESCSASRETLDGIHVLRYAAPPDARHPPGYLFEFVYCWIMTAWLTLEAWRRYGLDVFHACNPPETFFLMGALLKLAGKRFIFDHHDLSPEMYLAKGGREGGVFHRGLLLLERLTFRTADVVITANESHREIARTRGHVPAGRVFIVRSGPDFERLHVYPADEAIKGGFRYLACYLGEMCSQDGVDVLLEAVRAFVQDLGRSDTRFVLMGGGPELEGLRRLKTALGLDAIVTFTGRVSDDEVCHTLSTADICLDPDPYTAWADRSTMNKIMEYMTFGKPIVAFDLKEHRYSAQEAAVYVRPNDPGEFARAMLALLEAPAERERRGALGQARVRSELAWDFSQPHLLAAYAFALGGGPGSGGEAAA